MQLRNNKVARGLGLLALLLSATACARQAPYPDRPIVLVSPWAAGGGTDRVARHLASLLERKLSVPVGVVNATGGAGVTGHSRGALARPDGYTLTLLTVEINSLHWLGLTNLGPRDFVPVALINRDPAALFVRADAPWMSVAELERAVRERPRALRASGTARGGIWHVSLVGWLDAAGLPGDALTWIPINGSAPSLQQLLAGGVDVVSCSVPEARTLLEAGKVRALGVMAEARLPQFPDLPTFAEQGRAVSLGVWRGLGLPLGTPADVVATLTRAVDEVLASQDYRGFMLDQGFSPERMTGADFAAVMAATDERMGKLLTGPGFASVAPERFGPHLFPALLAGALLLATLALAATTLRTRPRTLTARASDRTVAGLALVLAVVGLYLALSEPLGYLLAASLAIGLFMWRLGTRPRTVLLALLALVPTTYQLFAIWLRVPLPRGLFGW